MYFHVKEAKMAALGHMTSWERRKIVQIIKRDNHGPHQHFNLTVQPLLCIGTE